MAMKFEKTGDKTWLLDVCGYVCPHPQMYAKKSISQMAEGDIVDIVFDNPSSKETIIQMCEQQGHELIEAKTEGGKMTLRIEKG